MLVTLLALGGLMLFVVAGVVLIAAAALVDFSLTAAGICVLVAAALVVLGIIGLRRRDDAPGRSGVRRSGGTGSSSSEFHAGGGDSGE
ncbi:hypothetical protein ACIBCD_14020 [Nocardia brasiliensis]|uniref:hypothetical protein n=1 Tax=Nocardia brasiliensis TaxID=37326 RepID=UPI0037B62078